MQKTSRNEAKNTEWGAYELKFLSFVPKSEAVYAAASILKRIEAAKEKYVEVARQARVPYLLVGIIHYLEANNDFTRSVRDGSKLPAGKDWVKDAVEVMKAYSSNEWTVGKMLWTMEKHNGFGYKRRGIETPYLWSGTNLYKKGKYVRDGVFDPEAVSKQIGGALILRMAYLHALKNLEDKDKAMAKVAELC